MSIFSADTTIYSKEFRGPYILLDGGPLDYNRVANLYQSSSYTIAKVEVIRNPALEISFEYVLKGIKNPKENAEVTALHSKTAHSFKIKAQSVKDSHLKLLPLFHAPHPSLLPLILKAGFSLKRNGSPGVLGMGIYHTSFLEYAQRVHNCGVLLFNWVAVNSPTYVVQEDLKGLTLSSDAHYALVAPLDDQDSDEIVYRPIVQGEKEQYDELVAFEPAQILPRYLITLTPTQLKSIAPQPNKSSLFQLMGILFQKAEDELRSALLPEMNLEGNPIDSLSPVDLWLHRHIIRLLQLEVGSPQFLLLRDRVIHLLKIDAKTKKPAPDLTKKEDADYLKGLKHLQSDDAEQYKDAYESFLAAGRKGHLEAIFEIGNCYQRAIGVIHDEGKVIVHYREAADKGHREAQYVLSQIFKKNHYQWQNAIYYAKMAAKQGHPGAQDYLGHCYYNGYTVKQKYDKALKLFKASAEQGNESARYYLALCYAEGHGTPTNLELAFEIWKELADEGNSSAQYQVSQFYKNRQNYPLAIRYALLAAHNGHVEAQDYVGHCYYHGYTLPKNSEEAVYYFQLAAAKGNASSTYYLGLCYSYGYGIPKDAIKGAELFLTAAAGGFAEAQYMMGRAYKEGFGVKQNLELAKKYLSMAADQKVEKAAALLASLDENK